MQLLRFCRQGSCAAAPSCDIYVDMHSGACCSLELCSWVCICSRLWSWCLSSYGFCATHFLDVDSRWVSITCYWVSDGSCLLRWIQCLMLTCRLIWNGLAETCILLVPLPRARSFSNQATGVREAAQRGARGILNVVVEASCVVASSPCSNIEKQRKRVMILTSATCESECGRLLSASQ